MPDNTPDPADMLLGARKGAIKTAVAAVMKYDEESINKPLDPKAKKRTLAERQAAFANYIGNVPLMLSEQDRLMQQYGVPPKAPDDQEDKFISRAWVSDISKGLKEASQEE